MARPVGEVFPDMEHARRAVDALIADGMPDDRIRIIEASRDREGGFSLTARHPYDQHAGRKGAFADTEDHYHDRGAEREGSFADTEEHYHDLHQEPHGSFATGMNHESTPKEATWDLHLSGAEDRDVQRWNEAIQRGYVLVLVEVDESQMQAVNATLAQYRSAGQ